MTARRAKIGDALVRYFKMRACLLLIGISLCLALGLPRSLVQAIGKGTAVDMRVVQVAGRGAARDSAAKRLSWALRQRTSVETVLESSQVRFDDPALFDSP